MGEIDYQLCMIFLDGIRAQISDEEYADAVRELQKKYQPEITQLTGYLAPKE